MIQTTIRLPRELYIKIKQMSKIKGLTLNAIAINALWEFTEKTGEAGRDEEKNKRADNGPSSYGVKGANPGGSGP